MAPPPGAPLTWQAQGVVKDLDADLLQHLDQGTAFLQVSTKAHPHGEMRGRVGPHQRGTLLHISTTAQGPQLGGTAQGGKGTGWRACHGIIPASWHDAYRGRGCFLHQP